MGDAVSTRTKSRLQIMLLDQTAITMGENASLVIDEFVYDPDNAGSALSASVTQGAFRLVTGGVARNNPEGTKVKLPSAVLTIRGTTTEGNCDSTGCIVVLSGTGDQNSAGKKPSQILIESDKGSKVLKRTGFFVLISPDGTITEPERLDEEAAGRLAGLFDPLVGPGEGGYLGGKQLVDASGQPTADAVPFVEDIDDLYGDPQLQDLGYESTSNLPSGQLDFSGTGIDIGGPGAGGAYSFTLQPRPRQPRLQRRGDVHRRRHRVRHSQRLVRTAAQSVQRRLHQHRRDRTGHHHAEQRRDLGRLYLRTKPDRHLRALYRDSAGRRAG